MRYLAALTLALALTVPALAADEEADIKFFYPVITRRPIIEREIELKLRHEKSREGRETETSAALEWPLLPWWQIELEVPVIARDPKEGKGAAGMGDLEIQNKFLLFKSVQHLAQLAAGLELRLPSGSERRQLGGETAIEPFVTGGVALGPFDLLADLAYEWNLSGGVRGQREQELSANLAAAWPLHRWFTPFLELNTVTRTSGHQDEDEPKLRDRTQLYLTPGLNLRPLPGMTVRAGIQLPVSGAHDFDYALHGGMTWEF
jgi:hypothetical protein